VDASVDFSGDPAMLRLCVDALRPGGTTVIVAGEGRVDPIPVTATDFVKLELNLKGARASTIRDQVAVLELLAKGRIHPVIDREIPMSEMRFAHEHLESGRVSGRILIDPWS
jgi:putative oxidoreductase